MIIRLLQGVCSFALFAAKLIQCKDSLNAACRIAGVEFYDQNKKEKKAGSGMTRDFFVQAILGRCREFSKSMLKTDAEPYAYENRPGR